MRLGRAHRGQVQALAEVPVLGSLQGITEARQIDVHGSIVFDDKTDKLQELIRSAEGAIVTSLVLVLVPVAVLLRECVSADAETEQSSPYLRQALAPVRDPAEIMGKGIENLRLHRS